MQCITSSIMRITESKRTVSAAQAARTDSVTIAVLVVCVEVPWHRDSNVRSVRRPRQRPPRSILHRLSLSTLQRGARLAQGWRRYASTPQSCNKSEVEVLLSDCRLRLNLVQLRASEREASLGCSASLSDALYRAETIAEAKIAAASTSSKTDDGPTPLEHRRTSSATLCTTRASSDCQQAVSLAGQGPATSFDEVETR